MTRLKVLYIAGFERSGSTIVNRIFGQIDNFVAWGELRDVWQHAVLENRPCSCGKLFGDCEVWQAILDYGFGGINSIDANRLVAALGKAKRHIAFNQILPFRHSASPEVQLYLDSLSKFYFAIQSVTGCKVIVDSTKASWYGAALRLLPNIDLYTLHITRDPLGVCHSLHQRKLSGEPECAWYNPIHASLSWILKNLAVESFLGSPTERYLHMRFEDFVKSPLESVKAVLNLIGEESSDLSFMDNNCVQMKVDHIFTGSPSSRSDTGQVKLRIDERWKNEMSSLDKKIITFLTFFLSRRYTRERD